MLGDHTRGHETAAPPTKPESGETALKFVCDLSKRLANRCKLRHRAYLEAVEAGFGAEVDYAQLVKLYGEASNPAGRYSPMQIQRTETFCCTGNPGNPESAHISTRYVERQTLKMRMGMRRFTSLTMLLARKLKTML